MNNSARQQAEATLLTLNRLGPGDCAALARGTARAHWLAEDVIRDIVARSDGVPLFLEELTKSIL